MLKFTAELADIDWKQSSKEWKNCTNCNSQSTSFAKSESANGEQQSQSSWTHLLLWFYAWNLKIQLNKVVHQRTGVTDIFWIFKGVNCNWVEPCHICTMAYRIKVTLSAIEHVLNPLAKQLKGELLIAILNKCNWNLLWTERLICFFYQ